MTKLLISIKPEYVKNIINGTKKYEYRTKLCRKLGSIKTMLIYETTPTKMVVAEAEIKCGIKMQPEILWLQTEKESGISKEFFNDYFKNSTLACAYALGNVKVFDKPKPLSDYGVKYAPQSFAYVETEED